MYDYMKALHARFCKEPELQKVRAEMERTYREIKARLGQQDQETLLQLADLENELREEASLTSFIAGFRLGMGLKPLAWCLLSTRSILPLVSSFL